MLITKSLLHRIIKLSCNYLLQKASTTIVIFFITLGNTSAQELELAGVVYFNYPKTDIKNSDNNEQVYLQEFGAFLNFPLTLQKDRTILINGLTYAQLKSASYNLEILNNNDNKNDVYTITYGLTLYHKLNQTWNILLNVKPTLASDFEEKLSSDDFLVQGAALAIKDFSDNFNLGGGLIFTTQYGVPFLLPSLQLYYKFDKHDFRAFLPSNIIYLYRFGHSESLKMGFRAAFNGGYFNVTSNQEVNVTAGSIDKIIYSRLNIGPIINYELTNKIQIDFWGGYTTARKYRFTDFDENEYILDLNGGPFFRVGIYIVSPKLYK